MFKNIDSYYTEALEDEVKRAKLIKKLTYERIIAAICAASLFVFFVLGFLSSSSSSHGLMTWNLIGALSATLFSELMGTRVMMLKMFGELNSSQ